MHFTPASAIGFAVCLVGMIPALRLLLAQRGRPYEEIEGSMAPRMSRAPYLRPGPEEPAWWPEFEREFAGYVSLGDAARRPPSD
jgi:hypothetical protein